MKLNKWTTGLAAIGAISAASIAQADEKMSAVMSPSSTTLSGYVDTSAQWNLGDGQSGIRGTPENSHAPAYKYGGPSKADGFNLDAILLTLEKPLDETEFSAGYKVDLFLGPDANVLGTSSTGVGADFAVKQAYVNLNVPVGTGLNFKIGVFDSIVGYESTEADKNPNFTRSWGHTFEPSTHTGVLATYKIIESLSVITGIADTTTPTINGRATVANGTTSESYKAYMGAVSFTAPEDWGFLSGSSFYSGLVDGQRNAPIRAPQVNAYAGATLNTPVTGLRFGCSWDYARIHADVPQQVIGAPAGVLIQGGTAHSFAAYASYQATEKMSLHERAEYADLSGGVANLVQAGGNLGIPSAVFSLTSTVQYDLWQNVLSRLEFRWDRTLDGTYAFGGSEGPIVHGGYTTSGTAQNSFILAANIIYKF